MRNVLKQLLLVQYANICILKHKVVSITVTDLQF